MGVIADCGAVLRALVEATGSSSWPDWSAWATAVADVRCWHRKAFNEAITECRETRRIHPYRAVSEVLRALGEDTVICADGGEASFWAEMAAAPGQPGGLMSHGYLGCLGIGVPFAIGAQAAHPERRVAVITGDGSMGFHLQELDTLVRHGLPVVTVVLNNKAWGMCVHGQQAMYGANRLVGTQLGDARYDRAAEGLGCYGAYVDSPELIAPAIHRALASGMPACIEVAVDLDAAPSLLAGNESKTRHDNDVVLPYYD